VAAWLDDAYCPVDPDVGERLRAAVTVLEGAGATVDVDARPGFPLAKAADVFSNLLMAALCGGFSRDAIETMAAEVDDSAVGRTRRRTSMRHREWLGANESRLQMRLRFEEFFSSWDVLLMPVMPCTAIPHDHSEPIAARTVRFAGAERPYWDAASWMAPAGACYLPATVVPVGLAGDGLPVGIQIVGPYLHDRTTLAVAGMLETLLEPIPRPAFGQSPRHLRGL
jgi:amidase